MRQFLVRTTVTTLTAVALCSGGTARANDSTASLETGDLMLVPTPYISMLEEDLYLSAEEIRVRYLFRNTGTEAITTLVAFPLPPIEMGDDVAYAFPDGDPYDVVDFRLWIDGQPTGSRIKARAIGETGQDVTAQLAQWNIPITYVTPDQASADRLFANLDALPAGAIGQLRAVGAAKGPDWGAGFWPAWSTEITYFWEMTFPPGQDVEVHHAYTPVPTWTFFSNYDLDSRTHHVSACIDAGFEAGARRMLERGDNTVLSLQLLDYILTTANNWRGPIGQFRLTIDKGSTDHLVSLCRDGIRKVGATTFEWTAQNYVPDSDLLVLFVGPME